MGLFDFWTAVSRKDATWYHSQEVQHLQAQAMSQERQLQESNLCAEQEKQVVVCCSKVSILFREKPVSQLCC